MTSAKPVPGSAPEPPVRSGELLRHLSKPSDAKTMLKVAAVALVAAVAFTVTVGFMVAFPFNLISMVAPIGSVIAIWFLIYRPAREQLASSTDPNGRIELLVVPEGLVTRGGLDVYWREIATVHVDEREFKGKGIFVHVIVTLNTGEVRDRATTNQRMAFIRFGKQIDVQVGMIPKTSRKKTSTVLREQCERVGVPFSSQRRTVHSGTAGLSRYLPSIEPGSPNGALPGVAFGLAPYAVAMLGAVEAPFPGVTADQDRDDGDPDEDRGVCPQVVLRSDHGDQRRDQPDRAHDDDGDPGPVAAAGQCDGQRADNGGIDQVERRHQHEGAVCL